MLKSGEATTQNGSLPILNIGLNSFPVVSLMDSQLEVYTQMENLTSPCLGREEIDHREFFFDVDLRSTI